MKNDYDMIVHKLGTEVTGINIYPIGDLHIGSQTFNVEIFDRWIKRVAEDPNGYVVIVGDMVDNGLKNSKTNSYEATMRPRDQKQWLKDRFKPIAGKILGGVQGNHEVRSVNDSDDCPMYDVFSKLDIEDLYRENIAFLKVNLGFRNKTRQHSYGLVLSHGGAKARVDKFVPTIDGLDVFISGHTHGAGCAFPSKIVMDMKNECVRLVDYVQVVVPSFATFGGYAVKGLYTPQGSNKFPVIQLSGEKKEVRLLWI